MDLKQSSTYDAAFGYEMTSAFTTSFDQLIHDVGLSADIDTVIDDNNCDFNRGLGSVTAAEQLKGTETERYCVEESLKMPEFPEPTFSMPSSLSHPTLNSTSDTVLMPPPVMKGNSTNVAASFLSASELPSLPNNDKIVQFPIENAPIPIGEMPAFPEPLSMLPPLPRPALNSDKDSTKDLGLVSRPSTEGNPSVPDKSFSSSAQWSSLHICNETALLPTKKSSMPIGDSNTVLGKEKVQVVMEEPIVPFTDSMTEDERKNEKRKRNRYHARKSRARKKMAVNEFQIASQMLKEENRKLRQALSSKMRATTIQVGVDERISPNNRFVRWLQGPKNRIIDKSSLRKLLVKVQGSSPNFKPMETFDEV